MSPEQLRGKAVDHRSDIFSVGAILYESLTGRRAFLGDTEVDTITAVLREAPRRSICSKPEFPHPLSKLSGIAWRKIPNSASNLRAIWGSHSRPYRLPPKFARQTRDLLISKRRFCLGLWQDCFSSRYCCWPWLLSFSGGRKANHHPRERAWPRRTLLSRRSESGQNYSGHSRRNHRRVGFARRAVHYRQRWPRPRSLFDWWKFPASRSESRSGFVPIQWSEENAAVYGYQSGQIPTKVLKVNLVTGEKTFVQDLKPETTSGLVSIAPVVVNHDGSRFAYSYYQVFSELYVISGLR